MSSPFKSPQAISPSRVQGSLTVMLGAILTYSDAISSISSAVEPTTSADIDASQGNISAIRLITSTGS